jgi:hypothetical protein
VAQDKGAGGGGGREGGGQRVWQGLLLLQQHVVVHPRTHRGNGRGGGRICVGGQCVEHAVQHEEETVLRGDACSCYEGQGYAVHALHGGDDECDTGGGGSVLLVEVTA